MIAKLIWTIGFLIGATTHTLDLINDGWLPYDFRPLPCNIYWTSLTFLDPLAAVLIWVRERWGVGLGVAIMVSNVLVNGYTAFAAFVFWMAWRHWQSGKQTTEAA